jgi:serine protease inhibitor
MKNFIVIISTLFLLSSCEWLQEKDTDPITANVRDLSLTEEKLVDSNADFALRFFQELEKENKENFFIGPYSIHQVLSMAMNANEGEVIKEYLNVLGYGDLTMDQANQANKSLTEYLKNIDAKVKINIANSIWHEMSFGVNSGLKRDLENFYSAKISGLNFSQSNAHQVINQWVASQTNNLIKDLLDRIPPDAIMYMVNTIYFKGDWRYTFDPKKTKKENFYLENGTPILVDMMESSDKTEVRQWSNSNISYLEIPYSTGQYQMSIISAVNGSLKDISTELTAKNMKTWSENASKRSVILKMPKFKMRHKIENLNQNLIDMGLKSPFVGHPSNFTRLFVGQNLPPIKISRIMHEAVIEVDEKGTEAAAATIAEIVLTSVPSGPTTLVIDKPFYFLIREQSSGAILFLGKYSNPMQL